MKWCSCFQPSQENTLAFNDHDLFLGVSDEEQVASVSLDAYWSLLTVTLSFSTQCLSDRFFHCQKQDLLTHLKLETSNPAKGSAG